MLHARATRYGATTVRVENGQVAAEPSGGLRETPLCDLLDLAHPIAQAPIGSAASPELAAAVADAGALGHVAVTWRSHDGSREVVERMRSLTDGPVGGRRGRRPGRGGGGRHRGAPPNRTAFAQLLTRSGIPMVTRYNAASVQRRLDRLREEYDPVVESDREVLDEAVKVRPKYASLAVSTSRPGYQGAARNVSRRP